MKYWNLSKKKKILTLRPSECAYLDYKEVPYMTSKKLDFIKDVIAMLNTEEAYAKDKVIVIMYPICNLDWI